MHQFGDFWNTRNELEYVTALNADTLEITIESPELPVDSRLGIIVKMGAI